MRLMVAALCVAWLTSMAAVAQEKRVAAEESRILLLAPYLEDLKPTYQYFGWNAQGNIDTAYAGVARSNAVPSRAQVYLNQTAPNIYWRAGNSLDEKWIRDSIPYLKDKAVRVTSPAPMAGPFVRVARFTVDGAQCIAFELRHVTNDTGAPGVADRQSVSGIYCPPANVALDDALIQRVFEGIFVRRDGRIERALRGVDKPIPTQLVRGDQKQG